MFVSKIECRSAKSSFELSRPSWNRITFQPASNFLIFLVSETPAPNELESLDNPKLLLNFPSPLSAEKKKEMSESKISNLIQWSSDVSSEFFESQVFGYVQRRNQKPKH